MFEIQCEAELLLLLCEFPECDNSVRCVMSAVPPRSFPGKQREVRL